MNAQTRTLRVNKRRHNINKMMNKISAVIMAAMISIVPAFADNSAELDMFRQLDVAYKFFSTILTIVAVITIAIAAIDFIIPAGADAEKKISAAFGKIKKVGLAIVCFTLIPTVLISAAKVGRTIKWDSGSNVLNSGFMQSTNYDEEAKRIDSALSKNHIIKPADTTGKYVEEDKTVGNEAEDEIDNGEG